MGPPLPKAGLPINPVAQENQKPLHKAPPAFPVEAEHSTSHPAGKPFTSVILHSSFSSCFRQLSPSPTAVQVVCMCGQPTSSVPRSQLAIFAAFSIATNLFSGRHCHAPSPMTFAAFKAVMVPPLSGVPISSTGDSVSFRTWPSLHSSHLPYRCTTLAMPDSSFQYKVRLHLHICFLPIYSAT